MPKFDLSSGPPGTREVFEYLKLCARRMYTDNYQDISKEIARLTKRRVNHRRMVGNSGTSGHSVSSIKYHGSMHSQSEPIGIPHRNGDQAMGSCPRQ